jgi:hypothetical protein
MMARERKYLLVVGERLLEFGENAEGRDAREAQMILNHKAAIELLVDAGMVFIPVPRRTRRGEGRRET